MSTYAKSWLANAAWIIFALVALFGMFERATGQDSAIIFLTIGVVGYFLSAWLAGHYPKCPNCHEPVNDPHLSGDGKNKTIYRPDRPKRECGYCGTDLTGKTVAE